MLCILIRASNGKLEGFSHPIELPSFAKFVYRSTREFEFSEAPREDRMVSDEGLDTFGINSSILGLAVRVGEARYGAIVLWSTASPPTPDHVRQLKSFADLAAIRLRLDQAQKRIKNSEEFHKALITHLPSAVFLKTKAGEFRLANRIQCELFDVDSDEEVIGRTDYDFFSPEQADIFRGADEDILEAGLTETFVEVFHPTNKPYRLVQTTKTPIYLDPEEAVDSPPDGARPNHILGILSEMAERDVVIILAKDGTIDQLNNVGRASLRVRELRGIVGTNIRTWINDASQWKITKLLGGKNERDYFTLVFNQVLTNMNIAWKIRRQSAGQFGVEDGDDTVRLSGRDVTEQVFQENQISASNTGSLPCQAYSQSAWLMT